MLPLVYGLYCNQHPTNYQYLFILVNAFDFCDILEFKVKSILYKINWMNLIEGVVGHRGGCRGKGDTFGTF